MTVLPTVRRQLLAAAEHEATRRRARPRWRPGPRRPLAPHVGGLVPRAGTLVAAVSVAVALGVAALAVSLLHRPGARRPPVGSSPRSTSLLARPLHLPSLGPGGRCPASRGYLVNNPYFDGTALGSGPVRVLIAQRGDIRHGRVDLGGPTWRSIQTLWFALPSYHGRFVVRAARLGRPGPIRIALSGGRGPLVVPAGATLNTYPNGDRTQPSVTWIKSPGCYAWQVDGRGFSEVIVFRALRTRAGR